MKSSIRIQLSAMMFLNFFIWGAWFVTMGTFLANNLKADDVQNGAAYGTQSWGAILAPFIIGLIADRYFAAQKILGILHIVGACLMWYLAGTENFGQFFPALLLFMVLYMPTLALVNTISFRQMKNPEKEFPSIRVFGTIGWIVANLIIGWLAWEQGGQLGPNPEGIWAKWAVKVYELFPFLQGDLTQTFRMAALASGLLGLISFTLPNTPPPKKGSKANITEILGLDALSMLKNKSYLVFFISSVLICIPLAFYYALANKYLNELNISGAAGIMSFGQMSEIVFMLIMPILFIRLGVKKMLLIGMLAWALRYVFFAFGDASGGYWMLLMGIILHGICYDFFFVTGQIYTENTAGERYKGAAQGLITLATYGVGMLIGFYIAGLVGKAYTVEGGHDWKAIWLVPAAISAAVMLLFALFFREQKVVK